MRQQLDKALDHLILIHKIETEKKRIPGPISGKAIGLGIFLLGILLLWGGFLYRYPVRILTNANVGDRKLPIYSVETGEPKLALTLETAWGNSDIEEILKVLREQEVHATFFVTGEWVETYPEETKAILAAGHDLGNHGENHLYMSRLTETEKEDEIMLTHDRVKELTGYEMRLFRAPHGDYDNEIMEIAESCGYYVIQWDVDSKDWKDYGAEAIVTTVMEDSHLGNGSILLLHCGTRFTAGALDMLITELKEKNFSLVPVSELIYRENYYINQEGRQISRVTDY
ncbi:MAG: polysaccharide deacetylase family protein [Lachnospiraceae bacterium]|nr:polysaccharide deacetylase family protein [Lachnospiraceae bacterium]